MRLCSVQQLALTLASCVKVRQFSKPYLSRDSNYSLLSEHTPASWVNEMNSAPNRKHILIVVSFQALSLTV